MMLTIDFLAAAIFVHLQSFSLISLSFFFWLLAPNKQLVCWLLFLFNILHYACNFYMISKSMCISCNITHCTFLCSVLLVTMYWRSLICSLRSKLSKIG